MASSTLDPDNIPEPDRKSGRGHGTRALGPSDTSDSGSAVQGGRRWAQEGDLGLDKGTNEDPDSARHDPSAGPDIGDAGIDSDTDAEGTGERAAAGRDADIEMGGDIDVDRVDHVNPEDNPDLELDDGAAPLPPARNRDHHPQRR